ncbi:hypothetical protein Z948_3587 [Sulfitobacter donghicola DSW-25 = KCTC 12864 = JCM 14565]|nr:hypothetical protein Z948_3587 [Sulfitobacter donghicola DSW-25 = KCTC 12864 = JCM 14565]
MKAANQAGGLPHYRCFGPIFTQQRKYAVPDTIVKPQNCDLA